MALDNICGICGSGDYKICLNARDKKRQVVVCNKCKTFRTTPYFITDYSCQESYCEHYLKNEELFRKFSRDILRIIARYKQGGRFLDIGCSVGFMVEEAKKNGFNAEGLELNEKAVTVARSKGLGVNNHGIDDAEILDNTFDVVVLNHVAEHIFDISDFIKKIKRVIAQSGILVIGVPNHESLAADLFRSQWYGWGFPEHVWHFDRASLSALLLNSNFRIKEVIQNSMYYPKSKSFRKNTMAILAGLGNKLGRGDQLIFVAERY